MTSVNNNSLSLAQKALITVSVANDDRLFVRIPKRSANLKARLEDAAVVAGVDSSDIVIGAVSAACECIEKTGGITFPIKIANMVTINNKPVR